MLDIFTKKRVVHGNLLIEESREKGVMAVSYYKSRFQERVVAPATRINNRITTIGVVTSTNESNNTCGILYTDKNGKKRNMNNVVIRLYGNGADWFPSVNDTVVIEDTGDTVVVVARHVGNYAMDVRSKRQLRQDVYSDCSSGQPAGGLIM